MDTSKVLIFPRIMYKLADEKTNRRKNLVKWRGVEYESLTCPTSLDVIEGFKTLEELTTPHPVEMRGEEPINVTIRKQGRPRK